MATETIITEEKIEETERTSSRKREIAAAITAGVVTVALGLVASGLIEKVGKRVKNAIAPDPEKEENEN